LVRLNKNLGKNRGLRKPASSIIGRRRRRGKQKGWAGKTAIIALPVQRRAVGLARKGVLDKGFTQREQKRP